MPEKGENVSSLASPEHTKFEDSFVHLALKLNKLLIDFEHRLQPKHIATFRDGNIFLYEFSHKVLPQAMFHLHSMALK